MPNVFATGERGLRSDKDLARIFTCFPLIPRFWRCEAVRKRPHHTKANRIFQTFSAQTNLPIKIACVGTQQ